MELESIIKETMALIHKAYDKETHGVFINKLPERIEKAMTKAYKAGWVEGIADKNLCRCCNKNTATICPSCSDHWGEQEECPNNK